MSLHNGDKQDLASFQALHSGSGSGMPKSMRDASSRDYNSPWKKPATLIAVPSQRAARSTPKQTAHRRAIANPFSGGRMNDTLKTGGNHTSQHTVLNLVTDARTFNTDSGLDSPHPPKRQKMDQTKANGHSSKYFKQSSSIPTSKRNEGNAARSSNAKNPACIDVDDEDIGEVYPRSAGYADERMRSPSPGPDPIDSFTSPVAHIRSHQKRHDFERGSSHSRGYPRDGDSTRRLVDRIGEFAIPTPSPVIDVDPSNAAVPNSSRSLLGRIGGSAPPPPVIDVDQSDSDIQEVKVGAGPDTDPIEEFSEPERVPETPGRRAIAKGHVENMKLRLERAIHTQLPQDKRGPQDRRGSRDKQVPHIDLREMDAAQSSSRPASTAGKPSSSSGVKPLLLKPQKLVSSSNSKEVPRTTIKNSMKGRATKQTTLDDAVATSASGITIDYPRKGKKAPVEKHHPIIALPLEAFSLGCKIKNNNKDSEEMYWLILTRGRKGEVLEVRRTPIGKEPNKGEIHISFNVPDHMKSWTLTEPPGDANRPVVLQFRTSDYNHRNFRRDTSEYNPGSSGVDGHVTFSFMKNHANWKNGKNYEDLIGFLTGIMPDIKSETVRGTSCTTLWQKVQNAAELSEMDLRGEGGQFPEDERNVTRSSSGRTAKKPVFSSSPPASPPPRPVPRAKFKSKNRDSLADTPLEGQAARRSARLSAQTSVTPEHDEIILVYPPSGVGAINIHSSDLKRLDEHNYLNDTLIEFTLKLWLAELKEKDPDLAEQVHVFSSFFYKKLNVKDKEEGYRSVRKWTAKFDLFAKKYIFVPIHENFHWYLAIIYNPQYMLLPPRPSLSTSKPMTRKRKRENETPDTTEGNPVVIAPSLQSQRSEEQVIPDSCPSSPSTLSPPPDSDHDKEAVEGMLRADESASAISATEPTSDTRDDIINVDDEPMSDHIPEMSSLSLEQLPPSPGRQNDPMDIDEPEPPKYDKPREELQPEIAVVSGPSQPKTISASQFYGSSSSMSKKGKGKAKAFSLLSDESSQEQIGEKTIPNASAQETTYIFILDSLGSRHPQAIKTLSKYLEMEAADKKDIFEPRPAQGKNANVPNQPNYCDCGLYVIHFTCTFMKSPDEFASLILHWSSNMDDRKKNWADHLVKSMRETLKKRIMTMAETWKVERAAKDDQHKKDGEQPSADANASATALTVPDSDDEVVIQDAPTSKPGAR